MTANNLLRKLNLTVASFTTGEIPLTVNGKEVDDIDIQIVPTEKDIVWGYSYNIELKIKEKDENNLLD